MVGLTYRHDQKYRSSTWRPEWGRCPKTGKRSYPSRAQARTACRGVGTGTLYRCAHCDQFHLTSYPPNVARAITYLLESLRDERRAEKRKNRHAHLPQALP